jgi:hypothetical protein
MIEKNITLSSLYWLERPIRKESEIEIISNFYNTKKLLLFPFTKPISKIINLENAPMESK